MTLLECIVWALATYRLSHALIYEVGFLQLFDRLRRVANRSAHLGELFSCIWCMSMWVGFLFALIALKNPTAGGVLGYGLAFSGVGVLLHTWQERG